MFLSEPLFKIEPSEKFYLVDDEKMPRVSTILNMVDKGGLVQWAANQACGRIRELAAHKFNHKNFCYEISSEEFDDMLLLASKAHERTKDTAADLGTACHKAIENFLHGSPEIPSGFSERESKIIQRARNNFSTWWDEKGLKFIACEIPVASKELGFGGRIDILAENTDEKIILLDIKTSNYIYKTHHLQVAAYMQALFETHRVMPLEACIVHIPKETGDIDVIKINQDKAWGAFKALCEFFYAYKEVKNGGYNQ